MENPDPGEQPRREKLVIEGILAHPRYDGGSGPPPGKISLLPPDDSTAYIVEKIIIPGAVQIGPTIQRRLYYVVGWRDLPKARVAIQCHKAFDYVSPREVEEWEWRDLQRRDLEAKAATKEAKAAAEAAPQTRRPGRPRRQDAVPTPILDEEEEVLLARKKTAGGPSLSTPQKPRRSRAEDLEPEEYDESDEDEDMDMDILQGEHEMEADEWDWDEEDANALLQRKLLEEADVIAGEGAGWRASGMVEDSDVDMEYEPEPEAVQPSSRLRVGPDSEEGDDSGDIKSELPPSWIAERAKWDTVVAPRKPNLVPPTKGKSRPKGGTGRGPGRYPKGTKKSDYNGAPSGPVLPPAPSLERLGQAKSATSKQPHAKAFSTSRNHLTDLSSPHCSRPSPASNSARRMQEPPNKGRKTNGTSRVPFPQLPEPLATPSVENKSIAPGNLAAAAKPASSISFNLSRDNVTMQAAPAEDVDPIGQLVWEVKRLEGIKTVEIDGNLVRLFKVRWEGDWPPDQNPSWEPEENIDRTLVKKYLKKKAAREASSLAAKSAAKASTSVVKTQKTLTSWLGRTAQASISEASAGPKLSDTNVLQLRAHNHGGWHRQGPQMSGEDGVSNGSEDELAAVEDSDIHQHRRSSGGMSGLVAYVKSDRPNRTLRRK